MVLAVRTNVTVAVELMTVIRPVEPVLVEPVRKDGKGKHVNKVGYVNRLDTLNMRGMSTKLVMYKVHASDVNKESDGR